MSYLDPNPIVPVRAGGVQPTGETHEVALDDLFFSTTDYKGVIDEANNVFCRLARYPREVLMAAPHNIIRHPAMPGGAFKLVWDLLLTGKPACAYVLNMAADGSAYWVFATIVPIGDRFLSVRSRPCQEQLHSSVSLVYEQTRANEKEARESGIRKSEASRIGAALIEQAIADLGYADYMDFMLDLLPAELAARRALKPTPPGSAVNDPLHKSITTTVLDVEIQLAELTAGMEEAQGVATQLIALSKAVLDSMGKLESVLSEAKKSCDELDNQDELVVTALPAVRDKCVALAAALEPVAGEIEGVAEARRHFRFDVEVARLQNETIGRYVVAVSKGLEDPSVSSKAISSLSDALYALVDTDLAHDIHATNDLRDNINRVAAALRILKMVANTWRNLVDTRGMSGVMEHVLPGLDKALQKMTSEVDDITNAVGALVSAVDGFDIQGMKERLARISEESARF
jgi:aerotaxis receptor